MKSTKSTCPWGTCTNGARAAGAGANARVATTAMVLGASMACFWKAETGREECSRVVACKKVTDATLAFWPPCPCAFGLISIGLEQLKSVFHKIFGSMPVN
jgi:hypothetical protein